MRTAYNISMRSSKDIFEEQFLQMRERCLSLAADLDRVGRAEGGWEALAENHRLAELKLAIAMLSDAGHERARRVLEVFSDTSTAVK